MAITINNNAISLFSQSNFSKNISSLSSSIEKLSSGLRINRAADDSVSLSIANNLNTQALGLGQAVKNATDGMSIMSIIDTTLSSANEILNSVKTKATQGAQGTQTSSTRQILQSDISKLLEELDLMLDTASFNNLKLLNGSFSQKKFQIGSSSHETLTASIRSAKELDIGDMSSGQLSLTTTGGDVNLNLYNPDTDKTLSLKSINISYSNDATKGMGALADAINDHTTETGISAKSIVEITSGAAVQSGATSSTFAINDITIGSVTTKASDSNSSLSNAINGKTTKHGVVASIDSNGKITLSASDGRAIEVTGIGSALSSTDDAMSTFGYTQIYQEGPYNLNLSDLAEGFAVAFSSNLVLSSSVSTTSDSKLEVDSELGAGSILAAGSQVGLTLSGANFSGDVVTTVSSTLLAGSVLASGSSIAKSSTIGGQASNSAVLTTTADSLIESSSILKTGTVIGSGTFLTNAITTASGTTSAGSSLSADATLTADLTLTSDMLLLSGSSIAASSTFEAGTYLGSDLTLSGSLTTTKDMTLLLGSTIKDTDGVSVLAVGSTIGGSLTIGSSDLTITKAMTVKSGSTLSSTSELAVGSTIGGTTIINGNHTSIQDIYLESGSILTANSVIKSGTVYTNNIATSNGTISSGTTATSNYTTTGTNNITNAMTVKKGSVLANGSTLAVNSKSEAATEITNEQKLSLVNINVLTQTDSYTAMEIADAALNDIEDLRTEASSYFNQFQSSVTTNQTTKTNLQDAKSKILDVDFAEELENLTRMQMLVQSNAFSLTQANSSPANVYSILQGSTANSASQFFISVINSDT